ncbi:MULTISPECIES: hypothetical protein [Streptomyces]|uniref:hypothetical protein n=1 Tax=Streptomyces TaxID=1883 RepID=UPI002E18E04C|nr:MULTISPECIES: hypothetical protein [unclassified Streptomyces]
MGRDAAAWRDQYGAIPPQEALAHTFVLWLRADLYDLVAEQPGATDLLMREAFKALAADAGRPGCAALLGLVRPARLGFGFLGPSQALERAAAVLRQRLLHRLEGGEGEHGCRANGVRVQLTRLHRRHDPRCAAINKPVLQGC